MNATDFMVVGDFNEDASAKNMQEFMIESGLYEVLSELSNSEVSNRDIELECGSKFIDHVQRLEVFLNVSESIELIEFNKNYGSRSQRMLSRFELRSVH